ncbi:aldo/keto reductase [Paracoccus aminophilus]|uniref:Oxidoreductase n=1 Tax=Paracoccus aminophilus JCM 7686 TaxID=1367847 RepID=S5YGC9_PARAH|nr:aldo/keto reductase [Paracoccus aminophilus]AGT10508.1 oxidoreductase [Paracoccus aminophilus JCM 7686]
MKTVALGNSGVEVTDVCLGTMTFGNQTDLTDACAQMDRAVEAGITFLDVAEMYPVNPVRAETAGRSEEFIGEWLSRRGKRDDLQIATKVSGPGPRLREHGYNSAVIAEAIDASLKRLRTDVIDLYQLHWPQRGSYAFRQNWAYDPSKQNRAETIAHMEDCLGALDQAVKAGKIRAIGLSNESAWGTTRWIDVAERMGAPRMVAIQNEYSLLDRQFDTDLAEVSVNEDVTLLAYSPLAAGLLTGKYGADLRPGLSRAAVDIEHGGPGNLGGRMTPRALTAVAAYQAAAAEMGLDLVQMAIAFTRQRPFPVIPIIGATNIDQLDHLIAGLDLVLSDAQLERIAALHRLHPLPY